MAGDFCFRSFFFFGRLVEGWSEPSGHLAGWRGSISSTSRMSKAFLVGVGAGGVQLVGEATFCGCCHPSATCSGGKRSRGLSGGLARSRSLDETVAGSTRFPLPWQLGSLSVDALPARTSSRLLFSFYQ